MVLVPIVLPAVPVLAAVQHSTSLLDAELTGQPTALARVRPHRDGRHLFKAANHFIFNRSDVVSAIGAFVVGLLGNIYSRIFGGTAFASRMCAYWSLYVVA